MARRESVTKSDILNAAFLMAQEEGFVNVTARKLAAKAGCSTQPIFRLYQNMEELTEALYDSVIDYFDTFYSYFPKQHEIPFLDLGLAYIQFAQKEKYLFEMLFLAEKRGDRSMYELLNGKSGAVVKEIGKAKELGCKSPSSLFMKMWIFIHGAACMVTTGDYDLSMQETARLLEECFNAFS